VNPLCHVGGVDEIERFAPGPWPFDVVDVEAAVRWDPDEDYQRWSNHSIGGRLRTRRVVWDSDRPQSLVRRDVHFSAR
jgi:hypothetical protein